MNRKRYYVYWESINNDADRPFEEAEDYECDDNEFDTFEEAKNWLGDKFNNPEYYYIVTDRATHKIVITGWN